jgi:hypothetical protein
MGMTGRAMLEAIIGGESNRVKLAALAHPRIKSPSEKLREAVQGRIMPTTAFCCNCIFSRSMPSTLRSPPLTGRMTRALSPFASPSNSSSRSPE